MRNWILNICLCLCLLCKNLFPDFLQAHYFETAGCLYLTFLNVLLVIGVFIVLVEPKLIGKVKKKSETYSFIIEMRNVCVALVAVFAGHPFLGASFLVLSFIFNDFREQGVRNEQVSRNVSIRRIRTRR